MVRHFDKRYRFVFKVSFGRSPVERDFKKVTNNWYKFLTEIFKQNNGLIHKAYLILFHKGSFIFIQTFY